ncbi:flagellar motor switch protein FliM [Limnobacter thiooxidans]|uniref:Flagellar motor switch protein FliM n=1 Tax=Limnobacter thiooxidans TaxID=131080 RepID=A0AA86IY36_9BURK|nr:flagellar motor switch protein FliM [Limnobacter sp.]MCZ8017122.1 flagellar motor switch protein FliM [Limnobacter sp.]RZS37228.1 flagellar motor switch protein FliM [Limnobacter thiooxidans]BET25517.1 flagellar motor switch protein FliM [Limnobacter thiooxidans]
MPGEFLSQDEVDALLRGVNGEEETKEQSEIAGGVRPYNLATQERIVRGRMPTLEIINERFARLIRIGLFNFMRRSPEISVGPVKVLKYNEFIRNLVVPTNLNIMAMKPLRGNALFIFDPSLVFAVIDNLFGGDGRFHTRVEGRDFTQTEQRIIARMLEVIREEFVKAWAPVFPLKPEYLRSEMHTQFANIATPSEIVVTTSFSIELGAGGGSLHICVPYSTLEPIRDLLYSSMQGDQAEPDKRWVTMLKKQVQMAEVDLVASLANTQLTVADIMELRVGDVIPIEIDKVIEARVDNVPVFNCSYGTSGGQYALKVEEVMSVSNESHADALNLEALLNRENKQPEKAHQQ